MGGEDVSTEAEFKLLKENGIDADIFSINNTTIDRTNKIKLAINTIWSDHYYNEILNKIRSKNYDIVHVQNFFPLFSPSIFYAAKKAGAKVVMSVRNYRLICPNALMYVNNKICNDCVGKTIPYPGMVKKCYRDSYTASGITAAMLSFHNLLNTWKNKIDGFICISQFVKSQLILGNFNEEQLYVKYNFVSTDIPPNFDPEDYYIYAGRISTEKGIDLLLNTFEVNKKKLFVIGDGPLKQKIIESAREHNNIIFLGKLSLSETYQKIANAKALIFPSNWHEPFGRTIVESFAHGTPVIGSCLGGISELIKDGYNGFLFDPYKNDGLSKTIDQFEGLLNIPEFRKNSYSSYKNNYDSASNFSQLINIYNKILSKPTLSEQY